jgi:hypothetical protein
VSHHLLQLELMLTDREPDASPVTVELRTGDQPIVIETRDGTIRTRLGPAESADATLTDDALLSMPPVEMRFEGAERIGRFFATEPVGGRLDRIALVEVRANGQPALAGYADEDGDGVRRAYGVMK